MRTSNSYALAADASVRFTALQGDTGHRHRAVYSERCERELVQSEASGPDYEVADPLKFVARCTELGLAARVLTGTQYGHFSLGAWRRIVEVCGGTGDTAGGGAYSLNSAILFGNDGHTAIRILPGLLRLVCLNQFYAVPFAARIWHNDAERVKSFMSDPRPEIYAALNRSAETVKVLESPVMRNTFVSVERLRETLQKFAPKTEQVFFRCVPKLESGGDDTVESVWGLAQAGTAMRSRFGSRLGDRLISNAIDANGDADALLLSSVATLDSICKETERTAARREAARVRRAAAGNVA